MTVLDWLSLAGSVTALIGLSVSAIALIMMVKSNFDSSRSHSSKKETK